MARRDTDEDIKLCRLLRGRLLQAHATTVCTCTQSLVHSACQCALDAPPEAALQDPWEFGNVARASAAVEGGAAGGTGGAEGSLAEQQAQALAPHSSALTEAKRDVRERGWRCLFITVGGDGKKNRRAHAEPDASKRFRGPKVLTMHLPARARARAGTARRRTGIGASTATYC
jgi:hypothetical protein